MNKAFELLKSQKTAYPKIKKVEFIELRHCRGRGVDGDLHREVVSYYTLDFKHVITLDPLIEDKVLADCQDVECFNRRDGK